MKLQQKTAMSTSGYPSIIIIGTAYEADYQETSIKETSLFDKMKNNILIFEEDLPEIIIQPAPLIIEEELIEKE